jgi:hypothetical protein
MSDQKGRRSWSLFSQFGWIWIVAPCALIIVTSSLAENATGDGLSGLSEVFAAINGLAWFVGVAGLFARAVIRRNRRADVARTRLGAQLSADQGAIVNSQDDAWARRIAVVYLIAWPVLVLGAVAFFFSGAATWAARATGGAFVVLAWIAAWLRTRTSPTHTVVGYLFAAGGYLFDLCELVLGGQLGNSWRAVRPGGTSS